MPGDINVTNLIKIVGLDKVNTAMNNYMTKVGNNIFITRYCLTLSKPIIQDRYLRSK